MSSVRCVIYTRKSSEEGLEQDFNSLDAQREACSAYILSQASEGWKLNPKRYDDGGLSGGTLERPALQELLTDIEAGRIDIVVVYKVDRLTRSLLDFAKLVEAMDQAKVSFVSVTQSFNTTTSMGRLTLNMLLSFAQFEREVTAERIRDKIAASKAKGMWMGGTPPLGYEPDGRSLKIVEEHAALVRSLFDHYLELGNVRLLAERLERSGTRSPVRTSKRGKQFGGGFFSRGQLYTILRNPIYVGKIAHKGKVFEGKHEAIVKQDLWERVQAQLTENIQGIRRVRSKNAALLKDLLFDETRAPLIPVHSVKKQGDGASTRYRYYVSKAGHHKTDDQSSQPMRVPAVELETLVVGELTKLLADPLELASRAQCSISPSQLEQLRQSCAAKIQALKKPTNQALKSLIERIELSSDSITLELHPTILGQANAERDRKISIDIQTKLRRAGQAIRLVDQTGTPIIEQPPNESLARLLAKAHKWWRILKRGELDTAGLADREDVSPSYVTRVLRLAFLAPDIAEAALAGADLGCPKQLMRPGAIPALWSDQREQLLSDSETGSTFRRAAHG